jgi:O-antigen ligase
MPGKPAGFITKLLLALSICLPFVLFFEARRNIDAQGLVLILIGLLAWTAIARKPAKTFKLFDKTVLLLIAVFMLAAVLSLVVNPNKSYGFYGAPYIRLGAAGLIACIGVGLVLTTVNIKRLITGLYVFIFTAGLVSVPYSLIKFHSLERLPGIFAQADIMAAVVSSGFILGLYLLKNYPHYKWPLLASQTLLFSLLLLTETRAVLVITVALTLIWQIGNYKQSLNKYRAVYLLVIVLTVTASLFYHGRVTDPAYASASVQYRLELQEHALQASTEHPWLGYGPGNLADALDCRKISAPDLKRSCRQGYFFNSSHNIFIDRLLMLGWVGGLAYFGLAVLALWQGLKAKPEVQILAYAGLLIFGYYFTNVTGVVLELLFWIILLRCLAKQPRPQKN